MGNPTCTASRSLIITKYMEMCTAYIRILSSTWRMRMCMSICRSITKSIILMGIWFLVLVLLKILRQLMGDRRVVRFLKWALMSSSGLLRLETISNMLFQCRRYKHFWTRMLGLELPKNSLLQRKNFRPMMNSAALKADPFVVGISSRHVPDELVDGPKVKKAKKIFKENIFWGGGVITECEEDTGGSKYICTILAPAALFLRTSGVLPHEIEVDVYLSDGKLCKGEVFACDFHYNLAAIRIQSDCPLQTAKFRSLDDLCSLDWNEQLPPFQLRHHSELFKVEPGTKIIIPRRCRGKTTISLRVSSGAFCADRLPSTLDCKELYWIKVDAVKVDNGGPIINCFGEVIGIAFGPCFLPSNIVLRWWNYYKSCGWKKMLQLMMLKYKSKDVIIKCNGLSVRSKLEFFEKICDKAGKSVGLTVLRDGHQLNVSVAIGETAVDKFYWWRIPNGWRIKFWD